MAKWLTWHYALFPLRELIVNTLPPDGLSKTLAHLHVWCANNPVPFGVAQMAMGAALVSAGVKCGAIEIGAALLATEVPIVNSGGAAGFLGGAVTGGWVGAVLGGIGVAAGGGAIGIPAALVAGGAAVVMGLAGYTAGDILHNLANQPVDPLSLVVPGSLLVVGTYLIIQGGRSILQGMGVLPAFMNTLSDVKDKALDLKPLVAQVIARSKAQWSDFSEHWAAPPESASEVTASIASTAAFGAGGLVVGGAVAASSVTVLGSSALGGLALSAGLVSAPLWPAIAGVAVGGYVGYSAFKAVRYVVRVRKSLPQDAD